MGKTYSVPLDSITHHGNRFALESSIWWVTTRPEGTALLRDKRSNWILDGLSRAANLSSVGPGSGANPNLNDTPGAFDYSTGGSGGHILRDGMTYKIGWARRSSIKGPISII
ncbi:hypothetical protein QVD99_003373 [Batrachochytrium dendrobatidis]|nr:hypothetical protein QVD99_003373 [Batrachochytrium dendrobatidis]